MARFTCIWCLQEKDETAFNVEHVMPQAFGTYEQNFTLVNIVCQACNSLFSRDLEPWLARDSLEGYDRYRYGQKLTSEFRSLGRRSTTRVQIPDGPYAGAWGFTVPGEEHLGATPFPQVGFAKETDGPFEWFMLDALPTLDDIRQKGYGQQACLRFCECDRESVVQLLDAKGIKVEDLASFPPPSGGMWVEQVFRPTLHHRRALAKIVFNYLAYQHGAELAMQPRFNAIRDLVLRGVEPDYDYYSVDDAPAIQGDKQGGKRALIHILFVQMLKDGVGVEGMVSLYNRFRHGFRLSRDPGPPIEPRGHAFDFTNRQILPMTR